MQALKRLFSSTSSAAAAETSQTGPPSEEGLGTFVGDSKSCPEGGRLHAKIEGRYVTVVRLDGKLSCIDSICFHAGGPLGIGDIEEVNGRKCIVCPWHYYKIDVETGDKYYQGMEFKDGKMVGGEWKSNGVRQRVHPVVEANGKIYVTLSTKQDAAAGADGGGGGGLLGCAAAEAAGCASGSVTAAPPSGPPVTHIDSDGYAFDTLCGDRVLNSAPSAGKVRVHSVGSDGRKPSGQVLRGQYKTGSDAGGRT